MDDNVVTHLLYEIKEEMNKRALLAKEAEDRVKFWPLTKSELPSENWRGRSTR